MRGTGEHDAPDDVDPVRRRLLGARVRPAETGLRPPWSRPDRFAELCTRCGDCAAACPEGIVVTGNGFPAIDFGRGECTFCGACAQACPTGALDPAQPSPWTARARIGTPCVALHGVVCRSCQDACPEGAIRFRPRHGAVARPEIALASCTGCGACVAPCPADAIAVQAAEPADVG